MSEVPHLLDERDNTLTASSLVGQSWWATWFPFQARISDRDNPPWFSWSISFMGAQPFATGKTRTVEEAYRMIADAKKSALKRFIEQLAEVG